MKTQRMVCTLLMMVGLCMGAMAQKSIDRIMEEMEKMRDVRITSVQKRDPKTKKVVRLSKTIYLQNPAIAKRLIEAFDKEEKDALTVIEDKGTNVSYTLKFQDKAEKLVRTYILNVKDSSRKIEVSVFIAPMGGNDDAAWWDAEKFEQEMKNYATEMKALASGDAFVLDMEPYRKGKKCDKEAMDKLNRDVQNLCRQLKKPVYLTTSGNVFVDGKRLKKGTHRVNGRTIIVQ